MGLYCEGDGGCLLTPVPLSCLRSRSGKGVSLCSNKGLFAVGVAVGKVSCGLRPAPLGLGFER